MAEGFAPHQASQTFQIQEIMDEDGLRLEAANQPMRIVKIKTDIKMVKYAMIRKVIERDARYSE